MYKRRLMFVLFLIVGFIRNFFKIQKLKLNQSNIRVNVLHSFKHKALYKSLLQKIRLDVEENNGHIYTGYALHGDHSRHSYIDMQRSTHVNEMKIHQKRQDR